MNEGTSIINPFIETAVMPQETDDLNDVQLWRNEKTRFESYYFF